MNRVPVMNWGRGYGLGQFREKPLFDVEFRQGKKSAIIPAYIDSGAKSVHARIPTKIADELGIEPTGTATMRATSQEREVLIGQIDYISFPKTKCTVANGIIVIGGEDVASLGQPFLAATGATVQYAEGKVRVVCDQKASPIGIWPQFSFDLVKGGRKETITAILDTGFTGGVSLTEELAKKLGLEKSSETDVTDASGKKWKAGVSSLDRVSFAGHQKCAVEGLEAYIYPEAVNQPLLVGEKFLDSMAGAAYLGYDENSAWAGCDADEMKIRSVNSVYANVVPPEDLPEGAKPTTLAVDTLSTWVPWAVGGTAVAGLAAWLLLSRRGR